MSTETSKSSTLIFFFANADGPVDQSGMIAALAQRKPGVQIPLGPLAIQEKMAKSKKEYSS